MTALDLSVARPAVPWRLIRIISGIMLLLAGLFFLYSAWTSGNPKLIGLGVILAALGAGACFDSTAESTMLPAGAIAVALVVFGIFVKVVAGKSPITAVQLMYDGAFGSWFSFQNTLTRAAPLMLTGLCTALPMRLGMVMIGGEGCLVMGALMAAGAGHYAQEHQAPVWLIITVMMVAGFLAGGIWLTIAGALKHYRGVNETISSLLLIYIGIALMSHMVEGPWRDPASLNKPSTWPLATAEGDMLLGTVKFGSFHMDVHWGLVIGAIACIGCWILMNHTTFGFSARVVGGNVRAAKIAGLSLGKIIIITCMIAGGMAGLAGSIEVAAVQGSCNATVIAGYGYAGILVAFLARQNPIAIVPVAILLGGIDASNGLLQRRLQLPDATVRVLQGTIFLILLASETYYGKLKLFQKKEASVG